MSKSRKWKNSIGSIGVLETKAWDITTEHKYLIIDSIGNYDLNGGKIDLEYSISSDLEYWSEWEKFYETDMFILDIHEEENLYFKLRAVFHEHPEKGSPELTSFNLNFKESHKVINHGDLICKPKIWITKKNGDGDIKLHNLESKETLTLENLKDKEVVFIDCDTEDVITSLPLTYRYDDHNDVFLDFLIGDNYLYGQGDFELDIKYQFRILQP